MIVIITRINYSDHSVIYNINSELMIQDFRFFSLFESLRYSIHLGKGNKCDSIQFWTRCSNLHAE